MDKLQKRLDETAILFTCIGGKTVASVLSGRWCQTLVFTDGTHCSLSAMMNAYDEMSIASITAHWSDLNHLERQAFINVGVFQKGEIEKALAEVRAAEIEEAKSRTEWRYKRFLELKQEFEPETKGTEK